MRAEHFYCSVVHRRSSTAVDRASRRQHGLGDRTQREHLSGGAEVDGFARHTVNHAGGFVLSDGERAGLTKSEQSLGAIGAIPVSRAATAPAPAASATDENSTSTDGRW